ncbi:MAG: cupin domain-containing protein [Acetobacteraceae bacterium]
MSTPRRYNAAGRKAKARETEDRILAALAARLAADPAADISFDALAEAAGVERRTVFRHFPSRAALLGAFWSWIAERLGGEAMPTRPEDFLILPPRVFASFDTEDGLIRASLHTPSGQEMRSSRIGIRRDAFAAALAPATGRLPAEDAARIQALAHLLYSAAAWETLKDYAGLSGKAAGETVAWAFRRLLPDPLQHGDPNMSIQVSTPDTGSARWVLGDRVRRLGDVPSRDLHVVEVMVPPGSGTPPHRHRSVEIFHVLAGRIAFGSHGDGPPTETVAGPGAVVTVPAWQGHSYRNVGDEPATMTAVLEGDMLAFFEDLATAEPPPPGPPTPEALDRVLAACARHGIELIGPPPG